MFIPPVWALNPTRVPSFVPSSISRTTMHMRQSSNTGDRLPEYIAFDRNGPPAYPSDDLRGSPARPKKAHTHLPHDETRAGASSPSYADDYAYTHNGWSSDMEANMAAASVCILPLLTRFLCLCYCPDRSSCSTDRRQGE